MAKYSKFMEAKNRMAEPNSVYVLHTQKPRFLAKVDKNSFEVVDDIDSMLEYYKGDISKVEGLLKRLADWHKAYKIYEKDERDRRIHNQN